MTRIEHLLFVLAEECAEVAQRASKAARFGLYEVQAEQNLSNLQRIMVEWADASAIIRMIMDDLGEPVIENQEMILAKIAKVNKFLQYSATCGTVD